MSDDRAWVNVSENWMIYDTVRIGLDVPSKYPGGFLNFTLMSQAEEIPFINIRNSSEAGEAYCNVSSKDKFPWAFRLESIGMRFTLADPSVSDELLTYEQRNVAKFFCTLLPDHAWFELKIREDTILKIKPFMLPPGFGPIGHGTSIQGTPQPSNLISSGTPYVKNRWSYGRLPVMIPRDTPVKGTLRFSDYGKQLLAAMATIAPFNFGTIANPVTLNREADIELTLRGRREVQQRGEWHYGADQG